ncbi:hypothetical protein D3C71_1634130 [compost metagenome]
MNKPMKINKIPAEINFTGPNFGYILPTIGLSKARRIEDGNKISPVLSVVAPSTVCKNNGVK